MNKNKPLVSVVMPAYNAAKFIVDAIESIQKQSFTDWELIIVDDNSIDETYSIVKKFSKLDSRIKVYKNRINLGVSATANIALSIAKGQYIARMDADDISMPNRFEKELNFLQSNKKTVAVGSQCQLIDADGKVIGKKSFPGDFKSIRKLIFERIPIQQPSLMVNTKLLPKGFIWYDKSFGAAEEIEMCFKFFQIGEVRNMDETLLKYRIHKNNTSLRNVKNTFYLTIKSRIRGVYFYGYMPSVKSILVTIAQLFVVTLLPNKYIYPVFSFIHGLKSRTRETHGTSLVVETV